VVRRVGTGGTITTVAGNGMAGYSGDGGPATNASLDHPFGLALDAAGNLYIADSFNNVIRQVKTNGIIVTVVGDGLTGYSGDGGAATNAALDKPESVAVNGSGNLFIADTSNDVVREVVPLLGRSLTLTNAGAAKAGYYQVVVTGPGGSVTSSVAQLIVSGKPLVYRSTVNTNKTFSLKLLSLPGSTNVVQRATNLVLHTVWQPISTNISAADGSWQFTDPKATNFSKSFYRFQTR
jgi:hypothetical protein